MNPAQRDHKIAELQNAIEVLRSLPVTTPCNECEHFASAVGKCNRWHADVPIEAQAVGCAEWRDGVIPF